MKIFITGAAGYPGNNLASRLPAEGHTIHALCRNADAAKKILHPSIKIFEGDITDKASVQKAISEYEQAYHLAAYARVWAKDMRVYERLNLAATKTILDAALHAGVQKTVFTSTGGVPGPSGM